MNDPVAHVLDQVVDAIEQRRDFCPPPTTILALRRLNAAMARLCAQHGAVVDDEGLVHVVGRSGPAA
jgi:hypothetical protein